MHVPHRLMAVRLRTRLRNAARARRVAAVAGAMGIAGAAVMACPSKAAAHGVAMLPGSRTYLCYKDLLANSDTQIPANPACKAAVQAAGTTPLYNWFAVLDPDAGGRGEGYVEGEGFDPEQVLGWSDLEHVQTVQDPPQQGGPGSEEGHYYWDLQLPERTGRHMLFIQWIRSDSEENFFSCSDLVFDGGNGAVTG